MTDPLAFLTAALDAAQRDAEAATPGPWYVTPREYDEDFEASIGSYPEGADIAGHGYEGGGVDALATATHIAANDPASVLRRIAADRKLIAEHADNGWRECAVCSVPGGTVEVNDISYDVLERAPYPCATIRNMAEGWGWTEETT